MCVQVANAFQPRFASQQRRLADVAGFLPTGCFQRLPQARQDVACLLEHLPEAGGPQRISGEGVGREAFGRQEQWPRPLVQFLKTFLADQGVGGAGGDEA